MKTESASKRDRRQQNNASSTQAKQVRPPRILVVMVAMTGISARAFYSPGSTQVIASSGSSAFQPKITNRSPAPAVVPVGTVWIPGGEVSMGASDPPDMNLVITGAKWELEYRSTNSKKVGSSPSS